MEIIVFLSIVIAVVTVLTSIVLIRRVKKQIAEMTDALVDVKDGNGNRRILSATNELTAPLAYEINEIVVAYESRLSTVRQTEETNRQLMTSLSHDVRTPLTTLIGYLDAAHKGLVTGKDRDDYIETARRKAHGNTFVNAAYLYDEKVLITFNYKDGTKTITFDEIAAKDAPESNGSDLGCFAPPRNST